MYRLIDQVTKADQVKKLVEACMQKHGKSSSLTFSGLNPLTNISEQIETLYTGTDGRMIANCERSKAALIS